LYLLDIKVADFDFYGKNVD